MPPFWARRRSIASGGGGRIEPHLAPLAAERGEAVFELRAVAHVGKLFEAMTDVVAELAAVDNREPAGPRAAPRGEARAPTGVCGMSLPRMLNSQETACGS